MALTPQNQIFFKIPVEDEIQKPYFEAKDERKKPDKKWRRDEGMLKESCWACWAKRGFSSLLVVMVGTFSLAMAKEMTHSAPSQPSGVFYFSNGASIEKFDLKTRKREEIIPWLDSEGRHESNSVYPVYSQTRNKMYFFRSYIWPAKCHLVVYDFINQKIEKTLDFCGEALSLSW